MGIMWLNFSGLQLHPIPRLEIQIFVLHTFDDGDAADDIRPENSLFVLLSVWNY